MIDVSKDIMNITAAQNYATEMDVLISLTTKGLTSVMTPLTISYIHSYM
jgi:hypothetical protein